MDFYLSKKHIRLSHQPVYPTIFVKNIQMYGVQKSGKCVCKSKNLNLDPQAELSCRSLSSPLRDKLLIPGGIQPQYDSDYHFWARNV